MVEKDAPTNSLPLQVPAMKLPYSAIAVRAQVTQDTAAVAIRRMVQELAVQVRRGFSLSISMAELGVLWSRGRTCGFKFEKKKVSSQLPSSRYLQPT